MLFSPDYKPAGTPSTTARSAELKMVQMVMILPGGYKETTLISLGFSTTPCNP